MSCSYSRPGSAEWVCRQKKRLLPEVFMQRTIFRELCGMELGLTSALSVLSLPWRNRPYGKTDVRLKSSLRINKAEREREQCWEVRLAENSLLQAIGNQAALMCTGKNLPLGIT